MPAKKAAKKSAKKNAKKAVSKSKKPASKKKPAKKAKKGAGAKKPSSKSKKLVSKKKPAGKSKKALSAKKAAVKRKEPLTPKPTPEVQPSTSGFIDAGWLEPEIYEPDPEVKEEFAEAAALGDPSRRFLLDELRENAPAESPILSGGDIDAAWDQADASGEETVGGSNPTPDQDVVDELGKAVGLTYEDDEPLDTTDKIAKRDEHRWELDPKSAEDFDERESGKV